MGLLNAILLSEDRQKHSNMVAKVSHTLAKEVGLSTGFAYLCGLLHDVGENMANSEEPANIKGFKILKRNGLEDVAIVALLHSRGREKTKYVNSMYYNAELLERVKPYIHLLTVANAMVDSDGDIVDYKSKLLTFINKHGKGSPEGIIGLELINDCNAWFSDSNINYHKFFKKLLHSN